MTEKLNLRDKRLIIICLIGGIISLFITLKFFKQAFPEASIDMDVTREEARRIAEKILANKGHDVQDYMHAVSFGFLEEAKTFMEYQLSAEDAGKILSESNGYYWRNRWFVPEQKEEYYVKISTSGRLAEYEHKIDEEAPGDTLTVENALNIARFYLVGTAGMDIREWELVESKTEKLENRWDHEFEWKEKSFDVRGSTHRLTVKVQGDKVDHYREWIKVPDIWTREYKNVRSKNDLLGIIGEVGLVVTIFLLFITVLLRARKKDVRWKMALTWSGVIAVVLILNEFNYLPRELYWYDTKVSFNYFVTNKVFQLLLLPMLLAGFFGFLIAGSEPFYRDQYPHQLSFRHIFTIQGLRSRSFFNSAIIGLSLTLATFAFQTIYYLVSNKLGGWSPTEVPDFDQLGTYLPWAGVLLGGLAPAFLEESLFRAFLIPFLQKYAKSTILAVVISSIIWGLGHAQYPSQPFYIRVLEVSAMGIFISWIFLRYGILATLIWHFSVDAVYSAMILLKSSNTYYLTTGAVCAGLILLPLLYAILAYVRNGGFISSHNLVNALDTEIFEEKDQIKDDIEKAKISTSYIPLGTTRVRMGLIIALLGIILFYFFSTIEKFDKPINKSTKLDKNRIEAIEVARTYLESRGFDLNGYRSVARSENGISPIGSAENANRGEQFQYILENDGKDKLASFLSDDKLDGLGWNIRFYKSETKREYRVWMLAKGENVFFPQFQETLSDTAFLPSMSKEQALTLTRDFASSSGIELDNMILSEEETIEKENRTDYYFRFLANDLHEDNIAESKRYYDFEIYGNHIGRINTGIKLPESWQREYRTRTIYSIIQNFSIVALVIILLFLGIRYLLANIKENKPNWKRSLTAGIIFSLIFLLYTFNDATVGFTYNTAEPYNSYLIIEFLQKLLSSLALGVVVAVLTLAVDLAWPKFFPAFTKENRFIYMKDAFVSFLCSAGLFLILSVISGLLVSFHPTYIKPIVDSTLTFNSLYLHADLVLNAVIDGLTLVLVIVWVLYIYRQITIRGGIRKMLVPVLIAAPFIMIGDPEIVNLVLNTMEIGAVFFLIRYFWRGNPWSYLLGVSGFLVIPYFVKYFTIIEDSTYQIQVFAAVLIFLIFLGYFAREAFFSKGKTTI